MYTWRQALEASLPLEITMSNSSRIEAATRSMIGATVTAQQVIDAVKLFDPTNTKGVYPSDVAGKQLEDGTITHRGKVPYGDLILLQLGSNSYRVLPTNEIVRRKNPSVPVAPPAPTVTNPPAQQPAAEAEPVKKSKQKKAA